ncbi:MAG TPA: hypothetical protein VNE62_00765 [Actinomycetota bacterium]|nr:hypothetical protein [Actinomycetota bacterium]
MVEPAFLVHPGDGGNGMDWTRQDTGYAVATAFALLLVTVLAATNFGLIPSPIAALSDFAAAPLSGPTIEEPAAPAAEEVPVLAADTTPVAPAPVPVALPPSRVQVPGPAPVQRSAVDTAAPVTTIETPNGASFAPTEFSGRVVDDQSGVQRTIVVVTPTSGVPREIQATLSCDGSRRSCAWRAPAPGEAGPYEVRARSVDAAGNAEAPGSEVRRITVVSMTPPRGQSDRGLLGRAVGRLVGLLG